ncbi:MAG: 6,7-dimethyl-8-ribityllumazine synthase [Muribaculaceae bacterium]|nr:6,7-dimethyl-8-ribityllumazine synthase [Muribaculaceae bacterium]MDE6134670.1 6,7-dimethyl-8-ribityllumazine synthase [Muribaculaceae bacterium]
MSTHRPESPAFNIARDMRVAIVTAQWNGHITSRLHDSAVQTLASAGIPDDMIDSFDVPGAVELTFAASKLIDTGLYDVIIVFGCVVRGGTPHFEYVCQSVTQGITHLNAECDIPTIFGVLTVDNEQDALDRCGGAAGDKGAEAAQTAIQMFDFVQQTADL